MNRVDSKVGGLDVAHQSTAQIGARVAIALEEPFLFSSTIAENIAFGDPEASFEAIRAAASMAEAEEFVLRMENGFATRLGERGTTLSGGQRQRLCLARSLLVKRGILVLDGATSSLDEEVEQKVLDNILGREPRF